MSSCVIGSTSSAFDFRPAPRRGLLGVAPEPFRRQSSSNRSPPHKNPRCTRPVDNCNGLKSSRNVDVTRRRTTVTYATELVQRYGQALHQLWNMHFWAPEPFRDYASVRQFDRLKLPLFLSLVVDRLGSDLEQPTQLFGNAFRVVPPVAKPPGTLSSLLIEHPGAKGAWKSVNGPFGPTDIKMCLLDFFDWNLLAWRDFRYYLVQIDECRAEQSLAGCRGLIEVEYVDILWEPPGILGLPRPNLKEPLRAE
jgi:hypothetical protein